MLPILCTIEKKQLKTFVTKLLIEKKNAKVKNKRKIYYIVNWCYTAEKVNIPRKVV